jgi:hypothetical protein
MMNGTVYNIGFNLNHYDSRTCDKLFDSVAYNGKASGKNKHGSFYKSKEIFAYSCEIKEVKKLSSIVAVQ